MKKLILMVMTVASMSVFFSCREQKEEKPKAIEQTTEEDEGILEKVGKEVDEEMNEEVDKTIDKIGDDN